MIRKLNKLLIIFSISLFLTSCWDYKDINERSITLATGIDFVDGKVEFTGELAKLTSPAGEEDERDHSKDVYVNVSYGKDFEEARILYDAKLPYPVFLGATQVAIFGERFARHGIEPYLNRINKLYDYRKTLLIVVSDVPPRKLFNIKQEKEPSVGLLVEDLVNNLREKKMTVYSNFGEMLSVLELNGVGYLLPYVGLEDGEISYKGLAVMRDSKLVGIVDYQDTDGLIYVLAEKPVLTESLFAPGDEENKYSLRTAVKKRKIKTEYKDGKVIFNLDMLVAGELRYQYYLSKIDDSIKKDLEKMVSQKLKEDIADIFERSQKVYKCDIFHFAKNFRAEHPKIYKGLNWEEAYITAELNINIETALINLGLTDPNVQKKY
ncbi:Ger(x)C family spore germination protein [Wukongibacter baidiensis]|uniref:Ger(x)C family spore germination protein n=1 Tax=Wukongibacter baidiensis TaxID=1723361 RepID=UPI003D7F2075